jgi:hypothetical protein
MTPLGFGSAGSIDATVLIESVTLADPNMKMGGAVLSGARPPTSAKLIATETERWAKVVKFSGAKAH